LAALIRFSEISLFVVANFFDHPVLNFPSQQGYRLFNQ